MSQQRAAMPSEEDIVGAFCAGWFVIGVDDGRLARVDELEDRLTATQRFIKSRQTVNVGDWE